MVNPNDKEVLKDKKEKFREEVTLSARNRGVRIPKINFWEVYDSSHFTKGERAHIHVKENLICIAEPELEYMSYDDIRETASHEVAHILNQSHDTDFWNKQSDTKAGLWTPPAGSVGALPEDYKPTRGKNGRSRADKIKCNYHLCRKKLPLKKCKYCGGYYCSEHHQAKPPVLPNFKGADNELMQMYRSDEGHPCPPYVDYLAEKKKKDREKYNEKLGEILGDKKNHGKGIIKPTPTPKKDKDGKTGEEGTNEGSKGRPGGTTSDPIPKRNRNWTKQVMRTIGVIIFLLVLYFFWIKPFIDESAITTHCTELIQEKASTGGLGGTVYGVRIINTKYYKDLESAKQSVMSGSSIDNYESLSVRLEKAEYPILLINREVFSDGEKTEGTSICDKNGIIRLDGSYV